MIDVYEATSQMTDESGQQYPFTVDTLLDRAVGAEGYYGAYVINAHTDSGELVTGGRHGKLGAVARRAGGIEPPDARLAGWPQWLLVRVAGLEVTIR